MNLEQFEKVEKRTSLLVEKISISLLTLLANTVSHGLKCMTFCLMRKNMSFEVSNRARTTSKPPVGFQLFICFVNCYELHCIRSRRRHIVVLNRKVFIGKTKQPASSLLIIFFSHRRGSFKEYLSQTNTGGKGLQG